MKALTIRRIIFWVLFVLCLAPFMTSALALGAGALVGLVLTNPYATETREWSSKLLKLAVVGLGFGIAAGEVVRLGAHAAWYTGAAILITFGAGWVLWKLFRTDRTTTALVTTGTAICGGSAIAAVSPIIKADSQQTGVALATVFMLNAVALILFPILGKLMGMTEAQFGVWAALAIHDTSSVIGAAIDYGGEAVEVATTVKIMRTLWLIPLVLIIGAMQHRKGKAVLPWFVVGFLVAATLRGLFPDLAEFWHLLHTSARRILVVAIYLIGAGLSRELVARIGARPMILAVVLWVFISALTLGAIHAEIIPIP